MSYGGTNEALIVGAVRTPIGRHGGALSAVRPDDLGGVVLEALIVILMAQTEVGEVRPSTGRR